MDRELALALAKALVGTTWAIRFTAICFLVIAILEIVSKWSMKSMIMQIEISALICIIMLLRLIIEVWAKLNCIITVLTIIAMAGNIIITLILIREKENSCEKA